MAKRVIPALLLMLATSAHALVSTINVNTFADIDDPTNPNACSLREAVKAIYTRQPYGGCPAGNPFTDNAIQLQSGDYSLTLPLPLGGEIKVMAPLTVVGNDLDKAARALQPNPLTLKAPNRVRPDFVGSPLDPNTGLPVLVNGAPLPPRWVGTSITAQSGQRIFNASANLTVRDVILNGTGGQLPVVPVAGNGGIILTNQALSLANTIIKNGNVAGNTVAAGNGGAIYLDGDGPALTLTNVTLLANQAGNKGGAIAMSCAFGHNPYAIHNVTISSSLFRSNTSTAGAGAIEFCGNTTATLNASTLSGNTSQANSGALAYVQGAAVNLGQMSLDYVTAAEQTGHVLAGNGLANVAISDSLLAFAKDGAAPCFNPDTTILASMASGLGIFNAIQDQDPAFPDSCSGLKSTATATAAGAGPGNNYSIPPSVPLTQELVSLTPHSPYGPFGLTDYYLPSLNSQYVLDKGNDLSTCTFTDQRNLMRASGSKCDIGAVERLQVSAKDTQADSSPYTDRLAIVDVLASAIFGEDDLKGPYGFAANTPATASAPAQPAVVVESSTNGTCVWKLNDDPKYPGKLVVSNNGVLTTASTPVTCTYHVVDGSGKASASATVKVQIRNQSPVANADVYVRPVGIASISFNPLENDNDDKDGIYGHQGNNPANPPDWAPFYPIEIVAAPELGTVVGASTGLCPGSSSVPRTCLTPPLTYKANDNLAPFTDGFSYKVYDADGGASNVATVTVKTDAPDPDHGGTGGSFDLLGGFVLSLLGLRRLRRL